MLPFGGCLLISTHSTHSLHRIRELRPGLPWRLVLPTGTQSYHPDSPAGWLGLLSICNPVGLQSFLLASGCHHLTEVAWPTGSAAAVSLAAPQRMVRWLGPAGSVKVVGARKPKRGRPIFKYGRSWLIRSRCSMVCNYSNKSCPVDRLGKFLNSAYSHHSQFTWVELQFCSLQSSTSVAYFSSVQFQRANNYRSLSTTSTVFATLRVYASCGHLGSLLDISTG